MIFRVIRDHLVPEFAVADRCRVPGVNQAGSSRWRRHPVGRRETRRRELSAPVRVVHEAGRRVDGSPGVRAQPLRRGVRPNRKTVARIMRESGLRSRTVRKFKVRTTDSNHSHPAAPNVLGRRFAADTPDAVWRCDITYTRLPAGARTIGHPPPGGGSDGGHGLGCACILA